MPWSYRYIAPLDTLVVSGTGVLSDADYTNGVQALRGDTRSIGAKRRFSDYTRVDRFEVTERSLEALRRSRPLEGRHAFLIFSPLGESEFERHVRKILAGNVRLFVNRKEAVNWLNEGVAADMLISVADTLPPDEAPPWHP